VTRRWTEKARAFNALSGRRAIVANAIHHGPEIALYRRSILARMQSAVAVKIMVADALSKGIDQSLFQKTFAYLLGPVME
jgi:hypothetical protein